VLLALTWYCFQTLVEYLQIAFALCLVQVEVSTCTLNFVPPVGKLLVYVILRNCAWGESNFHMNNPKHELKSTLNTQHTTHNTQLTQWQRSMSIAPVAMTKSTVRHRSLVTANQIRNAQTEIHKVTTCNSIMPTWRTIWYFTASDSLKCLHHIKKVY
jgi:hypothetical protein